jgi:BirA family biotin operon repressor/biotin-[acetyl-CoA-carboxylase] ligase
MKLPENGLEWIRLESTPSTQTHAVDLVGQGAKVCVVIGLRQEAGQGRHGRVWYSEEGNSLTASIIFWEYADHPKPWLIGMNFALAVAGATHCRISWPNDLRLFKKKVGGVLTTLATDPQGRKIPVVGIGLNLHVEQFPEEIQDIAGNIDTPAGVKHEPEDMLREIFSRAQMLPEPSSWTDLKSIWSMYDETAGKIFKLPTGEIGIGIGVGPDGELICAVEGETTSVMAADAFFGTGTSPEPSA